ncbi:hypothetical protein DYD21_18870 [Rhodohalobacter sp. SW132]|uniref:hypothetical protein n=1 Tax=Rhodohalobacter sp. SW132 TaxID=2293433 RepID=UPI000E2481BC|nr:hypothetical protein [Rhodohalobacter sp. SW132]REL24273.1 hypothetical protein DYD21_18870 [Rhodohalobacter sp. SW132]
MKSLLIELKHQKAYHLIKQLEALDLIRVVENQPPGSQSLSKQFSGKLSKETANKMLSKVEKERDQWDKRLTY